MEINKSFDPGTPVMIVTGSLLHFYGEIISKYPLQTMWTTNYKVMVKKSAFTCYDTGSLRIVEQKHLRANSYVPRYLEIISQSPVSPVFKLAPLFQVQERAGKIINVYDLAADIHYAAALKTDGPAYENSNGSHWNYLYQQLIALLPGRRVIMPDPGPEDLHTRSFETTVTAIRENAAQVCDSEGNTFEIAPERLIIVNN